MCEIALHRVVESLEAVRRLVEKEQGGKILNMLVWDGGFWHVKDIQQGAHYIGYLTEPRHAGHVSLPAAYRRRLLSFAWPSYWHIFPFSSSCARLGKRNLTGAILCLVI